MGDQKEPMTGFVESLAITGNAEQAMELCPSVTAVAGKGLEGDRYAAGHGFFSQTPGGGRALTLIEGEVLDALRAEHGIALGLDEHRRNVTTRGVRLNDLVGRRFSLGEVVCEGVRLCPPCTHLVGLSGKQVLDPLAQRGGLRADILAGGVIRAGDRLVELESPVAEHA